MRIVLTLACVVAILLLLLDPATYQFTGFDFILLEEDRSWQSWFAAFQGAALGVSAYNILRKRYRRAIAVLAVELLFFLALNTYYAYAYGLDRFSDGAGLSTLWVVAAGLVIRLWLLLVLRRLLVHENPAGVVSRAREPNPVL